VSLFMCEALKVAAVNECAPADAHNRDPPPSDEVIHRRSPDPEQDCGRLDPKEQPSLD
jgi:hypothetical protein